MARCPCYITTITGASDIRVWWKQRQNIWKDVRVDISAEGFKVSIKAEHLFFCVTDSFSCWLTESTQPRLHNVLWHWCTVSASMLQTHCLTLGPALRVCSAIKWINSLLLNNHIHSLSSWRMEVTQYRTPGIINNNALLIIVHKCTYITTTGGFWEKVNICLNYVLKSLKQGGYLAEDFNINNIRK